MARVSTPSRRAALRLSPRMASPVHLGSGSQSAGEGGGGAERLQNPARTPRRLRRLSPSAVAPPFPPVAVDARRVASSPQRRPPAAYARARIRSMYLDGGSRVAVLILRLTLSSLGDAQSVTAADGGWRSSARAEWTVVGWLGSTWEMTEDVGQGGIFRRATQGSCRSGLGIGLVRHGSGR